MTQTQTSTATMDAAAGSSAGGPAISARILKKRETDRKCQRMIRERTKSRIAYLEQLVEQFRQQDSSGRVETLMKQLSEMKDERDTLQKQVKNIESIVAGTKFKEEPETSDVQMTSFRSEGTERASSLSIDTEHVYQQHEDDLPSPSPQDTPIYTVRNKEYQDYIESSSRSSWAPSIMQPSTPQNCECSAHFSAENPSKPFNRWRFANDTLTEWFKWSPETLDMDKYAAYNDDIPVRAIVEGWNSVERRGQMHPIWKLLRGIDQHIFGTCEPRERLAILSVMGLLLQAHVNPTTEQHRKLPAFYLKRPSQDMLHSYATEYFAWPGLRERFIFSEHRYCSDIFWKLFCISLRFQWPFEFRDCYVKNVDTGLYRISPTFHERVTDIRCWSMGMEMFKQYPELYGDIPAWNHIPASLSPLPSVVRQARRALPSTRSIEEANEASRSVVIASTDANRPQSSIQMPIQRTQSIPTTTHQVHHSPVGFPQFSQTLSHSGSFDGSTTPLPRYDLQGNEIMTSMAEMQHLGPVHSNWTYNHGLDMFPLNTG